MGGFSNIPKPIGLNPFVQEIDNLPPDQWSQGAKQTHALSGVAPPAQQPAIAPLATPNNAQPLGTKPTPLDGQKTELNRITAPPLASSDPNAHTAMDTGRPGVDQIHPLAARIPLKILDTLGSFVAPRLTSLIPGTTEHHKALVGQQTGQVEEGERQAAEESSRRHMDASAANLEAMPELNEAKAERDSAKLAETTANHEAQNATRQATADTRAEHERGVQQHNADTTEAALQKIGMKHDPATGTLVPLTRDEMSIEQQSHSDLVDSQKELADAGAALKKAQAANSPALVQMAQQRIATAQKNSGIAAERLGMSKKTFMARMYGTDEEGNALPGSILGDDNKPVGSTFQANVRPTGQERNKADLANSAHEQLSDIKSIVAKRPDIFGPLAGRKTDFTVWLGSQDPDAQRFRAARTIAGDHLAGVFGGRSEAALKALDDAIGHYKDNPAAISAGIDQLDKANSTFQKKGTPKTAGSDAAKGAVGGAANAPQVEEWTRDASGKLVKK